MAERLALRHAQVVVKSYADEEGRLREHHEAMECRDCEDFLQLGIDAFDWIVRADQLIREAAYRNVAGLDYAQAERAVRTLCEAWLKPCKQAQAIIAGQTERGFCIENLARFRKCCEEMQAIVKAQTSTEEEVIPDPITQLRDDAIQEYRDGQTAEFI
jgi:hypothetical protein